MRATPKNEHARPASARHRSSRENGQVLVIFAGAIIALIGIVAIVVDVSWYWANSLRVQRTADAAALAGAVYLPGNAANAYLYAKAEATKNGYTTGGGITVTPLQDTANGGTDPRQLDVTVSAPVGTFFMRVFGINTIQATRTAKAIYVQPVPMGSPLSYYGVGCFDLSATHSTCTTAGQSNSWSGVPNTTGGTIQSSPANTTQLPSQGFWGAVQTRGGNQTNGDAFSPENNNVNCGSSCGANAEYDPTGYAYNVDFPSSGGSIYIFDPAFCAMGTKAGGGNYGTGDHWMSGTNPVSTYYWVYNTNNTSFTTADDTLVASSGTLFKAQKQSDQTNGGPGGMTDCSASTTHDKWWLVGQGNGSTASSLSAGTYRVQISTTNQSDATDNASTDAENMFSIMAVGGGSADVHGSGRMAAYNNLSAGTQKFYLAQVDQTAAGKTLQINLFDPGDVSGGAWLRVLSPDGNVYTPVSFNWTADANASSGHSSGSGTCLQTDGGSTSGLTPPSGCPNATSGGTFFQNSWVTIQIALPTTYGATGLTPAGEPSAGWWKIEYTVGGGSDLTTWEVNVLGNPVHLVVP